MLVLRMATFILVTHRLEFMLLLVSPMFIETFGVWTQNRTWTKCPEHVWTRPVQHSAKSLNWMWHPVQCSAIFLVNWTELDFSITTAGEAQPFLVVRENQNVLGIIYIIYIYHADVPFEQTHLPRDLVLISAFHCSHHLSNEAVPRLCIRKSIKLSSVNQLFEPYWFTAWFISCRSSIWTYNTTFSKKFMNNLKDIDDRESPGIRWMVRSHNIC
jgi:hypothetical protein